MKKDKQCKISGKLNNKGFSLVELIISIAILVIVMTPLMNNFFRAKLINNKAESLQVQSNLAANIMEGLKSYKINDVLAQFNGNTNSFDIIPGDPVPDVMRLKKNGADEFIESNDFDKQATYYFAIHGVNIGGTVYDAFIEMNSSDYSSSEYVDTMNNYAMPDVINLDDATNGLLQSKIITIPGSTSDSDALATFLQWGEAYAERKFYTSTEYLNYQSAIDEWKNDCETAQMQLLPTPVPPAPVVEFNVINYPEFCNPLFVEKRISKKMIIDVSQIATDQIMVSYKIEYSCNWTTYDPNYDGETTILYPISEKQYLNSAENEFKNIYLFYESSAFSLSGAPIDTVLINSVIPINFFAAKQVIGDPYLKIIRDSNLISVYKNSVNATIGDTFSIAQSSILKTQKVNRIFNVTVNICKYTEGLPKDKYKKVLYTIKSSMEE